MFEISKKDHLARIGILRTPHGLLKTPVIFPVHNLGAQGGWNTPRYWQIFPNIRTAMFNAYFILRNHRRVQEKIELAGGVHEFLDFDGVAFVDSGGYIGLKKPITLNQEKVLRIQEKIGADLACTLDYPFNLRRDWRIHTKIEESVINAKEAPLLRSNKNMLLYASVHGNDPIVLRNVIRYISQSYDFDGYALGSLIPIRSDFRLLIDLVISARLAVPEKPLHIFGLGGYLTTSLLAYLGVDSADSTSFIICAGKRRYFVPHYREVSMEIIERKGELPCNCPICCSKSIEEIRSDRSLIALHNLWALWSEIRQVRFAISEHRLEKYLAERFSRTPVMKAAFEYAKRRLRHFL